MVPSEMKNSRFCLTSGESEEARSAEALSRKHWQVTLSSSDLFPVQDSNTSLYNFPPVNVENSGVLFCLQSQNSVKSFSASIFWKSRWIQGINNLSFFSLPFTFIFPLDTSYALFETITMTWAQMLIAFCLILCLSSSWDFMILCFFATLRY